MDSKQGGKEKIRPRLDRRNAVKNINDDASPSPGTSDDSPYLRSPSLDMPPYSTIDQICSRIGLSAPDDFAISLDDWEANKAKSSRDLFACPSLYFEDEEEEQGKVPDGKGGRPEEEAGDVLERTLNVGMRQKEEVSAGGDGDEEESASEAGSSSRLVNVGMKQKVEVTAGQGEGVQEMLEEDFLDLSVVFLAGRSRGLNNEGTVLSSALSAPVQVFDRNIDDLTERDSKEDETLEGSRSLPSRWSSSKRGSTRKYSKGEGLLNEENGLFSAESARRGGEEISMRSTEEGSYNLACRGIISVEVERKGLQLLQLPSSPSMLSLPPATCFVSTSDEDDDTSSTNTDQNISPIYRFNIFRNWTKGTLLGSGSFGTVYEGLSDEGVFFAVKEVSLLVKGSQGRQCILQLELEIDLLSHFEHENIVRYLGTDKDESKLYIFLELITKGSLAQLYQRFHLQDSQVSAYTRQILHGLKYLHDRNVVHRDLRCANILVHANGSVKLADFGLAKITSKLNDVKPSRNAALWMAPEVINNKRGYGLGSDIWSLGCTVLEMLTRQLPYSHLENLQALFKIGRGELPPVPESLSSDAKDFIHKCLQVKPGNRPTAAQLLEHSFVKKPVHVSSEAAFDLASNQTLQKSFKGASRELIKKKVIHALMDDGTNIVGVFGMGGIGKTNLVKQIQEEIEQIKLFDKSVLVSVSQNPDLRCIQTQIAESLGIKIEEKRISARANILSAGLASRGENILLILDDMWKKLDLAVIGIILGGGSTHIVKALLTSRSLDVCHSMKTVKTIHVNVLSEYESLELFRKEVGDADFNDKRKLCEELVNECHGLPLAIVALARTLRLKDIFFWEAVKPLLKKSIFDGLDVVKTSIKRSYEYLQSNEIKQCFLLCALFPKDHKIAMDAILGYGLGEGVFGDDGTLREARGNLHLMVDTLISCSLLLKCNEEGYVIMHNVIRDTALWIARERKNEWIIKAGLGLKKWPNVETKSSLRISLMSNDIHEVPETPDCSQLVTLSLASNQLLKEVPHNFFEDMKYLGVLDLSETAILLLPRSLSSLKFCLRSLYLEDCKFIRNIAVIGDLKELEMLSLQRTDISELPVELMGLTNLKLLNLSGTRRLAHIPLDVISSLFSLEELYMGASFHGWEIEDSEDKAGLIEVATLLQLASLHFDIENPKLIYTEMSMCLWKNLRTFRINLLWEKYNDRAQVYERHLSLGNVANSFPLADWVKVLLERTFELYLRGCEGFKNVLQLNSKGFTNLKSLTIEGSKTMEYVMDVEKILSETMLPQLEILNLFFLLELKAIWNGPFLERSFKKLKILTVEGCQNLVNILPSRSWKELSILEEIKIVSCQRLEELGYNETEELTDEYNNIRIWLPRLRILYLKDLPRFSRLFSDRKKLLHVDPEFPSLEMFTIRECPSLERLSLPRVIVDRDTKEVMDGVRLAVTNALSDSSSFSTLNENDDTSSTDMCSDDTSSTDMCPIYEISSIDGHKISTGNWTKETFLGIGSFGTVYEGLSEEGEFFAVKEVALIDQGSKGQNIFQLEKEIAFLSQFEHENIVRYLGTDKDESKLYIFLELITKGSLAQLYQRFHLQDSQVSAYTRQILHGLKYLHDRNVVHRDLRCANILVHANGSVKLADFGLAKITSKLNDVKPSRDAALWMAPEVINNKRGYGLGSDIWSLGCTVLEMLTRQLPYSHLENMQALFRIERGEPPPVPDFLSSDAKDFIHKCLQVKPDNRPTAAQLLEHSFVKNPIYASGSASPLPSNRRR